MSTIAILPVKVFLEAKQRLRDSNVPVERRALVEAMLTDVLVALRRATSIEATIVVTDDDAATNMATGWEAASIRDGATSHSGAALLGIAEAVRRGATSVLLVPGDCPTLAADEVDALVRSATTPGVVVVPDRHGTGTNALVLTPPAAIVPAFGPGSCERHLELARAAGLPARVAEVPSLALDIDTADDFSQLRDVFADHTGGAAHTRGLLSRFPAS